MDVNATEATWRIWYCRTCGHVIQAKPAMERSCRCDTPVMPLRPTLVTEMQAPKPRCLQSLTDEEGRLRALARKGTRVRVTYEAEVAEAWLTSSGSDRKQLSLIVETSDGRRHAVDPDLSGVHIEAITLDRQQP